jgi:hypothetical protein
VDLPRAASGTRGATMSTSGEAVVGLVGCRTVEQRSVGSPSKHSAGPVHRFDVMMGLRPVEKAPAVGSRDEMHNDRSKNPVIGLSPIVQMENTHPSAVSHVGSAGQCWPPQRRALVPRMGIARIFGSHALHACENMASLSGATSWVD